MFDENFSNNLIPKFGYVYIFHIKKLYDLILYIR